MQIKYITVDKNDENLKDILSKIKREVGTSKLYAYNQLLALGGNTRILELKKSIISTIIIKVDGPEFLMKDVYEYFKNGGVI